MVSLFSGFYPQSNGQTECKNQEMEKAPESPRVLVTAAGFGWSMPTVVYRHPALLLACPLSIVHMAINHRSVGRLPLKPSFASAPNLWSNLLQTPLICQPLCSLCQSMLHSSTHLPGWPGSSTINIPLRAKSQVSAP